MLQMHHLILAARSEKSAEKVCLVTKTGFIIRKYLKLTGVAFSFPGESFPLLQEFAIFVRKQLFR